MISVMLTALVGFKAFALQSGHFFNRSIIVIFENTNYADALKQPVFQQLARGGALFSNFQALAHPSQGNYVGLTAGSLSGVGGDNPINLNVRNIVDLLEARGINWKVYAENYPGGCYTGISASGGYFRKHNPFISFVDIQTSPSRCAHIVEAAEFDQDAANGTMPEYVFYIPNIRNDGHDTGVAYANRWYAQRFASYLNSTSFMQNTVVITTFDESGNSSENQIYTSIFGPAVNPGNYSTPLNTVSILRLIEDNWNLGTLGTGDQSTPLIPNIWR